VRHRMLGKVRLDKENQGKARKGLIRPWKGGYVQDRLSRIGKYLVRILVA
jgi:hypothetical protein